MRLSVGSAVDLPVVVSSTPVRDGNGRVRMVVVAVWARVSELGSAPANDVVGMIGGDLNAPLTAIRGTAAYALAAGDGLDPRQAGELFRVIDDQALSAGNYLNDLARLSGLERGVDELSFAPVPVSVVVERLRQLGIADARAGSVDEVDGKLAQRVNVHLDLVVHCLMSMVREMSRRGSGRLGLRLSVARCEEGVVFAVTTSADRSVFEEAVAAQGGMDMVGNVDGGPGCQWPSGARWRGCTAGAVGWM